MKSWLYVGAKVVAVGVDRDETVLTGCVCPEADGKTIYTIRDLRPIRDRIGVWLVEITNPKRLYIEGMIEPCFDAENFAPVTTINTDSQIAAMRELMQRARDEKRVTVEA